MALADLSVSPGPAWLAAHAQRLTRLAGPEAEAEAALAAAAAAAQGPRGRAAAAMAGGGGLVVPTAGLSAYQAGLLRGAYAVLRGVGAEVGAAPMGVVGY